MHESTIKKLCYENKTNVYLYTQHEQAEERERLSAALHGLQDTIQVIDEINWIERFENDTQVCSEKIFKMYWAQMKQLNEAIQNNENSEMLLRENVLKLENCMKSKNDELKSKKVQIFTKLKVRRLKKNIAKTQRTFFENQKKKRYLNMTRNHYKCMKRDFQQEIEMVQLQIEEKKKQLHKGLTPETIQLFDHFSADKSLVGDQCNICMEDIEVGRKMMRLDCKHVFCQVCIEGWFADHNTCPLCRHMFN